MATTKISNLPTISAVTIDDNIIINDGNSATTRVTFQNFATSLVGLNLTVTGNTTFSGAVSGISIDELSEVDLTVAPTTGQVLKWDGSSWIAGAGSAYIGDLLDVDTTTDAPTDGQVLMWVDADSKWEPRTVSGGGGGAAVDSVNGQTGAVSLDADDISDASTTNQFVTSAQKTSIGTALQPGNNISDLNNDSNYLTSATGVTSVNGSSAGTVTLDPDDLDDVASTHKFVTAAQVGLIDNAVQPTDSIGVHVDVDTTTVAPVTGQSLVWNDTDSEWQPSDVQSVLEWTLGNVGTDHYTFTGPGFGSATNDPTLYLIRGQTYKFTNNMGAHPFRIQSTSGQGGTAYSDGITDNAVSNGTLVWEVRMDAPSTLYYQCTSHANMQGTIKVLDASGSAGTAYEKKPAITGVNPVAVEQGQLWSAQQTVDQPWSNLAWNFYDYTGSGQYNEFGTSGIVGGIENTPGTYTVKARAAWPFGISDEQTITVTVNSFTLNQDNLFGGLDGMQGTFYSYPSTENNYLAIQGAVVLDNGQYVFDNGSVVADSANCIAFYSYTADRLIAFRYDSSDVLETSYVFSNVTALPTQGTAITGYISYYTSVTSQDTAANGSSVYGKRFPAVGYYSGGIGGTHYLSITPAGTEFDNFGSTGTDWSYGFTLADDWISGGTANQLLSPTGANYFVNTIGAYGFGSSPSEYVYTGGPTSGPFSSSSTGTSWNISTDNWLIGSAGDLVIVTFVASSNTWNIYVEGVLKATSTVTATYMDATTDVSELRFGDLSGSNATGYPDSYQELGGWPWRLSNVFVANGTAFDQTAVTEIVTDKADLTTSDNYSSFTTYATIASGGITSVLGSATYARGDVGFTGTRAKVFS